jgi:hypothetical protein
MSRLAGYVIPHLATAARYIWMVMMVPLVILTVGVGFVLVAATILAPVLALITVPVSALVGLGVVQLIGRSVSKR